jgi:hypothetical protein
VVGDSRGPVRRLADVFRGEFVALLVCDEGGSIAYESAVQAARLSWPAPTRVVVVGPTRRVAGATVLRDPTGRLRKTYSADGARGWLIRPDRHLAGSLPLTDASRIDRLPGLEARAIGAG